MEKIHKAELILYGSAYDTYKGLIDTNIEKFQTALNTRLAREVLIARRKSKQAVFLLYRKDRLRRSLELKNARTEAGTTTRRFLV